MTDIKVQLIYENCESHLIDGSDIWFMKLTKVSEGVVFDGERLLNQETYDFELALKPNAKVEPCEFSLFLSKDHTTERLNLCDVTQVFIETDGHPILYMLEWDGTNNDQTHLGQTFQKTENGSILFASNTKTAPPKLEEVEMCEFSVCDGEEE